MILIQRNLRLACVLLDEAKVRVENSEDLSTDVVNNIIRQIGCQEICGNKSGRASAGWIKKRNPRMTLEAKLILETKGYKEFNKLTMNEHQWPVSSIWKHIIENYNNLTPENLVNLILEYPVTTVTKEQNKSLSILGDDPIKRYENLNLTVVEYLPKDCNI
tara:strand:- start:93 stop:575 length:483 start_codon:yes stop_codon:yes gene_type:complete